MGLDHWIDNLGADDVIDGLVLGVLGQLQHDGAVMPAVVADRCGVSVVWARLILNRLVCSGKVYRVGRRGGYVVSNPIDDDIVRAVEVAQRRLQGGVLAWQVQPLLPVYRGEGHIRRDMVRLWTAEKLLRVGGANSRQGYRVVRREVVLDTVRLVARECEVVTVREVARCLPDGRCERTVRRELVRLVDEGVLVRVGARRGYMVA